MKSTLLKSSLLFGVISGIVGGLIITSFTSNGRGKFAGHTFDYMPNIVCAVVGILIMLIAVRASRNNRGYITMGQCASLGLSIGVFAGIVSAFILYRYFSSVNPSALKHMIDSALHRVEDIEKITNAFTTNQNADTNRIYGLLTPKTIAFTEFFKSIYANLFFAVIAGAFLRKDPPELEIGL
jgi:hypothetical protein